MNSSKTGICGKQRPEQAIEGRNKVPDLSINSAGLREEADEDDKEREIECE
jgi:hypothetical protein